MKPTVSIALLAVLFMAACSSGKSTFQRTTQRDQPVRVKSATLVHFESTARMSHAMEKAQRSGKLIFLDFYTDYCPPCKVMDEEVFSDRETADFFNANFVNVKVDGAQREGANLASLFGVGAYPTLIFTDEKGNALMRKEGGTSLTTVRQMAESVLQTMAAR